jgi:hypothetical protein
LPIFLDIVVYYTYTGSDCTGTQTKDKITSDCSADDDDSGNKDEIFASLLILISNER